MPNAREYIWNKRKREDAEEYEKKIKAHRIRLFMRFLAVAAVILALAAAVFFFFVNWSYSGYKTAASASIKDGGGTIYKNLGGNILRIGKDGASCLNRDLEELWKQTYEMNSPIVDVCGNMAVVADKDGNQLYIFGADGLAGEIETDLPIEKVRVSGQGLAAVVLKGDNANWINLYDKKGSKVAENKTSLINTGYPMDMDISEDGSGMIVSFLYTNDAAMTTKIAFYNFGSVGKSEMDNLVSASEYEDAVAPITAWLDNETSFALCDDRLLIFKGSQIPELSEEVKFKDEIQSVCYDEDRIALIFKNKGGDKNYRMEIYDASGRKCAETGFDAAYENAVMSEGKIVTYSSASCTVFDTRGREKYSGKTATGISSILPIARNRYLLVSSNKIRLIKLTH